MAVNAAIYYSDLQFSIELYPGEPRERVGDDPPGGTLPADSPFWFEWDGDKLERGEYEFLGLTVHGGLARVSDDQIRALDGLSLPRITCPDAGIADRTVSEVVRWARENLAGSDTRWLGWPSTPVGAVRKA